MKINYIRYICVYLGTVIVLAILATLLNRFVQYQLPPGLATIIPAMIAAMVEGQILARADTTKTIENGPAWRTALTMTGLAIIANIPVIVLLLRSPQGQAFFDLVTPGLIAGIVAALLIATLLMNRLFFTMGFRNQKSAIERQRK